VIFLTVPSGVAKLPRLMQPGPPQFFDPARLADSRDELSGALDIDGMHRLHALLSDDVGSVQFTLHFVKDEHGRIRVSGQYSSSLSMECQRCLGPVQVDIAGSIDVVLLFNEEEAGNLPGKAEPLILVGREVSLLQFLEDELLLALPLAPSHDTQGCHAQSSHYGKENENRQRPFAALKDLKLKNSKD